MQSTSAQHVDGGAGAEPITMMSAAGVPALAVNDLVNGLAHYEVWSAFAVHDIRQRFRRSILGPFWLTLTMGVLVGALSLVFGTVFKQDLATLIPHIAAGVIFWGLFTSTVNDGATVFSNAESFIRNVPLPLSVHLYRMLGRNIIIWLFNMVIYVIVMIVFPHPLNANFLLFVPGFALLLLNMFWVSLAAGILSARFRDIPLLIANVIQVVFFLTPVFWSSEDMPDRPAFVEWNPMYHLLDLVRKPLFGEAPGAISWVVGIGLAVVGTTFAVMLFRKTYSRIPYWV